MLRERCALVEAASEAYRTFISSKAALVLHSWRSLLCLHICGVVASVDDKTFPDVTADDVMNGINVFVVILVVEVKYLGAFNCSLRALLIRKLGSL